MDVFASKNKPWLKYYEKGESDLSITNCSLIDFIKMSNKGYYNDYAINYYNNRIKYQEFFDNVYQAANAFYKLGVRHGDIITVCSVTIPEVSYAFYGLNLLGAIVNAVDPRTSAFGINEYINEVDSKIVCTLDVAYPKIKEAIKNTNVKKVIVMSPSDSLKGINSILFKMSNRDKNNYDSNVIKWNDFFNDTTNNLKLDPVDSNDCCLIVHTGGTTGSPKGVMINAKAINSLALQYSGLSKYYSRGQKFLDVMPPFIAYGFCCGFHMPLVQGLEIVIVPSLDVDKLPDLLKKYKPEHTCGVPMHFESLIKNKKMKNADLSYLVTIGIGGDSMLQSAEKEVNEFIKKHGAAYNVSKGYGMTEISSTATTCFGEVNKFGSIGIPLCNTVVSVFEPGTNKELPIGSHGEICVKAPQLMMGYYNNQEETDKVLITHEDGQLWMHSGDIGYMDEDGFIFLESRIKRIIIRPDGFKIFPSMIENIISNHELVDKCSVVAIRDITQEQGSLPYVVLVLKEEVFDRQKAINEIKKLCKKELAEYLQPEGYLIVSELPYTKIGKVDYRALEQRVNI